MTLNDRLLDLLAEWESGREAGCDRSPQELCPDDLALQQQLAARIERRKQFLASGEAHTTAYDETPNSATGVSAPTAPAGRFRPVHFHARGGLGEIHVAADDELPRQVALKRIRPTRADDPMSRARFLREAELTSSLEHPGIVPVYGLVNDADGAPCYAMRFVAGDSLKDAIERAHNSKPSAEFDRSLRQLLNRFVAVCQAIAFAHSKGVIHRDIKPANIMLGEFGETYVVDWGLAKRAESENSHSDIDLSSAEETATGQIVGSPAYMSPEQARADSPAAPASDVYSLGATLYHILSGQAPFAKESAGDIISKLQNGKSPRPIAGAPAGLTAVCAKAMSQRPECRYATATDLGADIERWLADEPVTARREPVSVRAWRWVRRHRTLVTTAAAGLVLTAVGLGGLAWQREKARQEIVAERDVAKEQKRRTREALDTMVSKEMIERLGTQKELTASQREFLKKALTFYREFATEAATEEASSKLVADAHFRIGFLLQALGQDSEAVVEYLSARAIQVKLASDFPAVPQHRDELATSHNNLAILFDKLGNRTEALAEFRAALSVQGKLADEYPATPKFRHDMAICHNSVAKMLADNGNPAGAETEYQAAFAIVAKLVTDFPEVPEYRQDLARSHNGRGVLFAGQGKSAKAEAEYRAALLIQEKLVANHPDVPGYGQVLAVSHSNLGALLALLGRREEAVAEYRVALAINAKLAADFPGVPKYWEEFAASHNYLGVQLAAFGKRPEAVAQFRAALAVRARLAADYPAVPEYRQDQATSYCNLSIQLANLGRLTEAEAACRAAIAICEKLAADFPAIPELGRQLANGYHTLGTLLQDFGKQPAAEAEYRAALAIRAKLANKYLTFPGYLQDLASSHNCLGVLLAEIGKKADAESEYRAALSILSDLVANFPAVPAFRKEMASGRNNLGALLADRGERTAAEFEYRAAIAILQKLVDEDVVVAVYREDCANCRNNLGHLLASLGKQPEAETEYRAAIAILEKLVEEHIAVPMYRQKLANGRSNLGVLLASLGKRPEAEAEYRAAIPIFEKLVEEIPAVGEYRQKLAHSYEHLGNLMVDLGNRTAAEVEYRKALTVREKLVSDSSNVPIFRHDLDATLFSLSDVLARQGKSLEAATLAERVVTGDQTSSNMLFDFARVFAQSSAAAKENLDAERLAVRAVQVLQQAIAKDFRDFDRLKKDKDLDPLRNREDFMALMKEVENQVKP